MMNLLSHFLYKFGQLPSLLMVLAILSINSLAQATLSSPSRVPIPNPIPPALSANSYYLVDFHSGKVLASKQPSKRLEPASLTKMMTMYIVDTELSMGRLSLEDKVLISEKAWRSPGSRMFVEVGSRVSVQDLVKGVIIQSGNDASIALAEHIAGSEQSFAQMMNAYAAQLNMADSHFVNSTGLPHPKHYSTAHDMSLLARAIIRDFPTSYQLYSQKSFVYNGIKQNNRNLLLWRNPSVDGIKTGYTENAGYCLVASGRQANMRLISVVIGADNSEARSQDANKLLAWGFRFFETKRIYQAGQTLSTAKLWMGQHKQIALGLQEDIYLTLPTGYHDNLQAAVKLPKIIQAPVKLGSAVGTYEISLADDVHLQRPVVALSNEAKGSLWTQLLHYTQINLQALWSRFSPAPT